MKLPPDVEFHEDVRLVVWRPRGVLNRAAVNRIITVIGELEGSGSRDRFHHCPLCPVACDTDSRFADQCPHLPESQRSRTMARRPRRAAGGEEFIRGLVQYLSGTNLTPTLTLPLPTEPGSENNSS
jgi:hypothetical protein